MKHGKEDSLENEIANLCKELYYISETDSPVEAVSFNVPAGNSSADYVAAIGKSKNEFFEEIPADIFFSRLTREESWHTETERKRARQFADLWRLMKEKLKDIKVLRFGKIRIEIFVIGREKNSGRLVGIRTMSVET